MTNAYTVYRQPQQQREEINLSMLCDRRARRKCSMKRKAADLVDDSNRFTRSTVTEKQQMERAWLMQLSGAKMYTFGIKVVFATQHHVNQN